MTRKQFIVDAYNNGEIGQGIFGQFAVHNFDDKIAVIASERNWVSAEFIKIYLSFDK